MDKKIPPKAITAPVSSPVSDPPDANASATSAPAELVPPPGVKSDKDATPADPPGLARGLLSFFGGSKTAKVEDAVRDEYKAGMRAGARATHKKTAKIVVIASATLAAGWTMFELGANTVKAPQGGPPVPVAGQPDAQPPVQVTGPTTATPPAPPPAPTKIQTVSLGGQLWNAEDVAAGLKRYLQENNPALIDNKNVDVPTQVIHNMANVPDYIQVALQNPKFVMSTQAKVTNETDFAVNNATVVFVPDAPGGPALAIVGEMHTISGAFKDGAGKTIPEGIRGATVVDLPTYQFAVEGSDHKPGPVQTLDWTKILSNCSPLTSGA